MKFVKLGWGEHGEIASRILRMTVIRDDDAAAAGYCPYYLATGDIDAATAKYSDDGGTVSAAWTVGEFLANHKIELHCRNKKAANDLIKALEDDTVDFL